MECNSNLLFYFPDPHENFAHLLRRNHHRPTSLLSSLLVHRPHQQVLHTHQSRPLHAARLRYVYVFILRYGCFPDTGLSLDGFE